MKRIETINFNEFMSGEYGIRIKKIQEVKRNRIYKVVLVGGMTLVLLSTVGPAFAASGAGIDVGAYRIYRQLLRIGKWIIIVKGGIDTINAMMKGDHSAAKKGFLTYLVVYLILNGLPWAMDQVDGLFKEMGTTFTSGGN